MKMYRTIGNYATKVNNNKTGKSMDRQIWTQTDEPTMKYSLLQNTEAGIS